MKPITQTLTELTAAAFAQCGYDPALGVVGLSDRLDLCQFQCNGAFAAAKQYHKAPFVIAGEVAAVLAENLIFAEVQAVRPGFLNLTVTDVFLAEAAKTQMADPHLGIHQADFPETIFID